MDACGVGRHQGVELAKAIGDRAPVETDIRADFGWVESGFPNRACIVESGGIDSDSGGRINAEAMLLRVTRASCGRG